MSDDQKISVPRHVCCLTREGDPHRFNCPVGGLRTMTAGGEQWFAARIEQTADCCPMPDGKHTDNCTSNEAVLSRVNLEEARLAKMAKAAEHRMLYGNPLDRLKQLVDSGQISATPEQVDGGTFIRFESNVIPGVETRYGPLQTSYEEAFKNPSNIPDPPKLITPQNRVIVTAKPVKYYPCKRVCKRVNSLRRRVGWALIQLGYRVAGV